MDITKEYLRSYPEVIFVYGDNMIHKGKGGAAKLRDEPNTYGFITKKYPCLEDRCYFKPEEYNEIFREELKKLLKFIIDNQDKTFLISKLGSMLANKFGIFESIIEPNIKKYIRFTNVKFLW
jgi:hypothetical protein